MGTSSSYLDCSYDWYPQGDREFEVEINVLARLRHHNLVTLRGACTEGKNRMAVFDFMPGGSLRDNLDRRRQSISSWQAPRTNLLWPSRIEIALGAAKGLRFLHEVSIYIFLWSHCKTKMPNFTSSSQRTRLTTIEYDFLTDSNWAQTIKLSFSSFVNSCFLPIFRTFYSACLRLSACCFIQVS